MEDEALKKANRLEGILKRFIGCNSNEFGVKANGNLDCGDWQSPINFALGFKYSKSDKNPEVKEAIEYFLGNVLTGKSIADIIKNCEYE